MMTPAEWQRRKAVFEAAMDIPPAGRPALIAEICAGDEVLAEDVRRLVQNAVAGDPFLDAGAVPSRELAPGQVLCERFELLRLAGEGGMGQVWAARDRRLGETVAIKTIQLGLAGERAGLARFQRELQLARRIGHPNVCRVYELFEDKTLSPPRVFLTMELLEGETLAARIRREGRLVPAEALRLFEQAAAALQAAHAVGVVHRDLKPANIMLTPEVATGQERAVLMDFGLARVHEGSAQALAAAAGAEGEAAVLTVTQSGLIAGTPEYMAPEQIRGEAATPATDVYAMGLLLYEMLDGQAPFEGKNTMDSWMRRIREGPPKLAAGEGVPGLDPRVDGVIARCLEYEPAARFASASDAYAALSAPPPRQSRKGWRIPRWGVAMAIAAIALVALGWAGQRWWRDRAGAPPEDARRWYEDAQRDLSEGAAARAASELRRATARAPRFAAAHAALAETQLELDQVYQARESIQRATDLAPDRSRLPQSEALHIEGINRLILRDCPGATDSLRRRAAVMVAADRPTALALLARAYERCEMTGEARKALDEAAAADPRNAAVRVRAAYLASRRQDRDTETRLLNEAEALYRERANFEGVAEVLATRGMLAAERDQLDEAAAVLSEALALARTTGSAQQQVRVLLQQAIVARKRGELADAERITKEGVELARRNDLETLALQGLFTAANVHFIRNQFDQAEAGFDRALEIATRYRDEGNQARAWLSLASMNVRRALPDKAAEFLARARPFYEKSGNARVGAQIEAIDNQIKIQHGDYGAVETSYREMLTRASGNASVEGEARRGLRNLYLEMGRWPEALHQAEALKGGRAGLATGSSMDLLAEAETLAGLGRFGEAWIAWRKVAGAVVRPPTLGVRLTYVGASIDVFEGSWTDAARKLAVLQASDAVDPLTSLFAASRACQVAAWSTPTQALRSCAGIVELAERTGNRGILALSRLALAESRLYAGATEEALAIATSLKREMNWWGASEWRWRAEAILAATQRLRSSATTEVAPFDAKSRLGWETAHWQSWSARPDLSKLLALSARRRE